MVPHILIAVVKYVKMMILVLDWLNISVLYWVLISVLYWILISLQYWNTIAARYRRTTSGQCRFISVQYRLDVGNYIGPILRQLCKMDILPIYKSDIGPILGAILVRYRLDIECLLERNVLNKHTHKAHTQSTHTKHTH